jgi:hypothetical protein
MLKPSRQSPQNRLPIVIASHRPTRATVHDDARRTTDLEPVSTIILLVLRNLEPVAPEAER